MNIEQIASFSFGVVILIILLILALKNPYPTDFQYLIMRVLLALGSACVAVFITGFLKVEIKKFVEAGGAFAVFVIVYFKAPAALPQAANWVELRATWSNLRDIYTDPAKVNQDDVVRAINAVNKAARILTQQPKLIGQFRAEYENDFCNLYLKLYNNKLPIHHENKTSDQLLSIETGNLAKQMECTK